MYAFNEEIVIVLKARTVSLSILLPSHIDGQQSQRPVKRIEFHRYLKVKTGNMTIKVMAALDNKRGNRDNDDPGGNSIRLRPLIAMR